MTSPALPPVSDRLIDELVQSAAGISYELREDADLRAITPLLNSGLLAGGKRIRPMLCVLLGKAFHVSAKRISPFARAAELTHCASLAHDDVIDRSTSRRGKPTLQEIVGETRAILSGDILLAQVMLELLEASCEPSDSAKQVKLTRDLAQSIRELSLGEWLETEGRGKVPKTSAALHRILELKTGSLTRWCTRVAPVLAGASDQVIDDCASFGLKVGLAFQMMDDVLDFETGTGKPFAQDLHEGVINTVSFELIQNHGLGPEIFTRNLPPDWIGGAQSRVRQRCSDLLNQAHDQLARALSTARSEGLSIDSTWIENGGLRNFLTLITSRKN